ncbi:hypothetical protein FG379_000650 [Cryptosporidium bovis]|uniref:uncharacterized protein n=1 Tax=Cryptosporidium bovis TaxID=310047 RepID=UPI00351A2B43|nr:hypothetical protein FG379_000650 [Cryptosporidium bovis]
MRIALLFIRLFLFCSLTIICAKDCGVTAIRASSEDASSREVNETMIEEDSEPLYENSKTESTADLISANATEVPPENYTISSMLESEKDVKSEMIETESDSDAEAESKYDKPEAKAMADINEGTYETRNEEKSAILDEKSTQTDELQINNKGRDKIKEEDELHELKILEEFKQGEMMEKGSVNHHSLSGSKKSIDVNNNEEDESKYNILSETIDDDRSKASVNITGENEYSIGISSINQLVNTIIKPFSSDEKQFQIEMKEETENESDMDDNKQEKSVIMTFDLSTNILSNKIPLISESDLVITRYTGITPQNIKITILDPTVNLENSQVRLTEISKFDSIESKLGKKAQSKSDTISLGAISSQIPVILQQFNTSNFRILLEPGDTGTQFGILSNLDQVGPILKIGLKQTIESNSTWMYTITGVAIIFVIIGVSIALYFQNKNKESSQKIENVPLLGNKV